MAVLAQETVGKILYQIVDDVYPTHTGVGYGSICINQNGEIFNYTTSDEWLKLIHATYSEMWVTSTTAIATVVQNSWYIFNTYPWVTLNISSGFTYSGGTLKLNENEVGRYFVNSDITWSPNATAQIYSLEFGSSLNNAIPSKNYSTRLVNQANERKNINVPWITILDGGIGDFISCAFRWTSKSGGANNNYIARQIKSTILKLDEPTILLNENFETTGSTSGFTSNWTVVNGGTYFNLD